MDIYPVDGMDEIIGVPIAGVPHGQQPAPETLSPVTVAGRPIDYVRLKQEPDYFLETMKYIQGKARMHYNNFRYVDAQELFELYFRYLRVYRPHHHRLPVDFYPALLEFSWVLEIQGQRQEAQKLLNQELLRVMEPALMSLEPKQVRIQEKVVEFQQQEQFPSPVNLRVDVPVEKLVDLAKMYTAIGEPVMAAHLLRNAEVRFLLDLYRLQAMSRSVVSVETQHFEPLMSLPVLSGSIALPVAPVLPITAKDAQSVMEKTVNPDYRLDKVNPVSRVNQDSRGRERQGRRQRNTTKKQRAAKASKKPRITL